MTNKQETVAILIQQRQHEERRASLILSMIEKLQIEHSSSRRVIATVDCALARYERQSEQPAPLFEVAA